MRPKVFINTRFNMVMKGGIQHTDKSGRPTRTDEWLKGRFELFEQVCLPSLMAQTDTDFLWLVFFSDRTPEPFLTRIAELQQRFPPFIPCFLPDFQQQERRFKMEVHARIEPADEHIISARIDNDDAFHRTFIERLRNEFHGQDDEIINFLNGIQYDRDNGVLVTVRKASNPFIARIERVKEGKVLTVLDLMHHHAAASGLLRDVDTIPVWLQLIHKGNLENEITSVQVQFHGDLEKEFGIPGPTRINVLRSIALVLKHRLFIGPMRSARRAARRMLKGSH